MTNAAEFSIAEIERATGISCDILRVWERRYGFPTPLRNQRGERVYSEGQLSRLRLLKQLLDSGMRPGKLIKLDDQQLRELTLNAKEAAAVPAEAAGLLDLLAHGVGHELLPRLEELLQRQGLRDFLTELVAPANQAVGEAWFEGRIGIVDEHHYSEQVRRVLTSALDSLPREKGTPRVLLTTLPGEVHGIGLLMVACMLCLEGAQALSLGVQTPLEEIVRGAVQGKVNVVGISCSEYMSRRTIIAQLSRLRKMLPEGIDIWAGGSGLSTIRFLPDGISIFSDLRQIPPAIQSLQLGASAGAS
jgi:DNA-binding transcriptional MerR regulator/methylmalonyl-CoA mutase cobalamin-binding subunit